MVLTTVGFFYARMTEYGPIVFLSGTARRTEAETRDRGIRLRGSGEPKRLRLLPSPDCRGSERAAEKKSDWNQTNRCYSANASTARLQTLGAKC